MAEEKWKGKKKGKERDVIQMAIDVLISYAGAVEVHTLDEITHVNDKVRSHQHLGLIQDLMSMISRWWRWTKP